MRISLFTDSFYPKIDGVVVSITEMIKLLAAKGHHMQIFCPNNLGKQKEINLGKNIIIERLFSFFLPSYPEVKIPIFRKRKVLHLAKTFDPDILYFFTPGPIGAASKFIKKELKIPLVGVYSTIVAEQLMYFSPKRLFKIDKFYEKVLKIPFFDRYDKNVFFKNFIWKLSIIIYKKCDIIIVPSNPIKQELKKRNVKIPIEVVSFGLDVKKVKKRKISKKPNFSIIHAGRLAHEKKIELVIESFALITNKHPNAKLDIIGDGPSRISLELLASRLKLNKKITFHGYIKHVDLLKRYKDYDLFVTASDMETLGLVVVEAMAAGLPVVGVDKNAIPSVVMHGMNGIICKPYDIECIARSSEKILSNNDLYRKFSINSLKYVKKHDVKTVANVLEQIFLKLVKSNQVRSLGSPSA